MNTFQTAGAPRQVSDLYNKHREEMIDAGRSPEMAHQYGLRMLRLGGWYRTGQREWKQLTPDLRKKVNVREAVKQPDGRYVIDDVDVFYPNAVKQGAESPEIYSADDIRRIIANTNSSIEAGGWRPTLIEGHQHPGADMIGNQFDGHGYGVNWTESPRGEGWARCTLVDVEPEYVDRIRDRKLPGLSARISNDAGKLNRRFGHIALLGGTPPALSRLPMLEVFSVSNQVCFSAEPAEIGTRPAARKKGPTMPLPPDKARKMAECFSSLGACYASYAAGEDGADAKMAEAHQMHGPALAGAMKDPDFGAYLGEMGGGTAGQPGAQHADAMPEPDASASYSEGSAETEIPEETLAINGKANGNLGDRSDFSSEDFASGDIEARFNKLLGKVNQLAQINGKLAQAVNVYKSRSARHEFHAECDALRKKGHALVDQKEIDPMWENCFSAADPKKAVSNLMAFLVKTSPKGESAADFGVSLGMDGMTPVAQQPRKQAGYTHESLAREMSEDLGKDFSSQDVAFAEIFTKGLGTLS